MVKITENELSFKVGFLIERFNTVNRKGGRMRTGKITNLLKNLAMKGQEEHH